jgi:predicted DNA-binding transcriptional regulator YafY
MADNSHNSLDKRVRDTNEMIAAERLLLKGTTVNALAEALSVSTGQARRIIRALKALGCEITDDFEPGTRDAAVYKMRATTRRYSAR